MLGREIFKWDQEGRKALTRMAEISKSLRNIGKIMMRVTEYI